MDPAYRDFYREVEEYYKSGDLLELAKERIKRKNLSEEEKLKQALAAKAALNGMTFEQENELFPMDYGNKIQTSAADKDSEQNTLESKSKQIPYQIEKPPETKTIINQDTNLLPDVNVTNNNNHVTNSMTETDDEHHNHLDFQNSATNTNEEINEKPGGESPSKIKIKNHDNSDQTHIQNTLEFSPNRKKINEKQTLKHQLSVDQTSSLREDTQARLISIEKKIEKLKQIHSKNITKPPIEKVAMQRLEPKIKSEPSFTPLPSLSEQSETVLPPPPKMNYYSKSEMDKMSSLLDLLNVNEPIENLDSIISKAGESDHIKNVIQHREMYEDIESNYSDHDLNDLIKNKPNTSKHIQNQNQNQEPNNSNNAVPVLNENNKHAVLSTQNDINQVTISLVSKEDRIAEEKARKKALQERRKQISEYYNNLDMYHYDPNEPFSSKNFSKKLNNAVKNSNPTSAAPKITIQTFKPSKSPARSQNRPTEDYYEDYMDDGSNGWTDGFELQWWHCLFLIIIQLNILILLKLSKNCRRNRRNRHDRFNPHSSNLLPTPREFVVEKKNNFDPYLPPNNPSNSPKPNVLNKSQQQITLSNTNVNLADEKTSLIIKTDNLPSNFPQTHMSNNSENSSSGQESNSSQESNRKTTLSHQFNDPHSIPLNLIQTNKTQVEPKTLTSSSAMSNQSQETDHLRSNTCLQLHNIHVEDDYANEINIHSDEIIGNPNISSTSSRNTNTCDQEMSNNYTLNHIDLQGVHAVEKQKPGNKKIQQSNIRKMQSVSNSSVPSSQSEDIKDLEIQNLKNNTAPIIPINQCDIEIYDNIDENDTLFTGRKLLNCYKSLRKLGSDE